MEKIDPKTMRRSLASGCSMWAPLLPPEKAAVGTEAANDRIAAAPVTGLPDAVALVSGQRARLKLFRDL